VAASATLRADVWTGTSHVTFKGTSTLHDFEGTVPDVPLKVIVKKAGDTRVISATSNVEVVRMTTREKERDEKMWAMFRAPKFRLIQISVPETPESALRPSGGQPGTMPITLTMAGTENRVTGTVTQLRESGNTASFDLSFPVSLKAFNLDPPKALAGLVKVGDTVAVTVQVRLTRQKP
jgi:YceI-like domain